MKKQKKKLNGILISPYLMRDTPLDSSPTHFLNIFSPFLNIYT